MFMRYLLNLEAGDNPLPLTIRIGYSNPYSLPGLPWLLLLSALRSHSLRRYKVPCWPALAFFIHAIYGLVNALLVLGVCGDVAAFRAHAFCPAFPVEATALGISSKNVSS
jgi:hypothetical protein